MEPLQEGTKDLFVYENGGAKLINNFSMGRDNSSEARVRGRGQSWALSVFFNFFNNKKWIFTFFIKLIWLGFFNNDWCRNRLLTWQKCKKIIFYYWKNSKIPKVPSSGRGLIAAYYHYCRLVWTFQHVSYRHRSDNIFVLFGLIITCVFRLIINIFRKNIFTREDKSRLISARLRK